MRRLLRSSLRLLQAPAPECPAEAWQVSQRGSRRGVQVGQGALVYDRFDNGARFAIVVHPEGRFGLMLSHPAWRLRRGQEVRMSIRIDDEVFTGKALVTAFYRGRKGRIEVGDDSFDMNSLPDAAAAIDDVVASLRRAAR